jgi:hypothetical protein
VRVTSPPRDSPLAIKKHNSELGICQGDKK